MRRGLAASGEQARLLIEQGVVLVGGAVADKAARLVASGEPVEVTGGGPRFVSRGGEKLDAGLERFEVDVTGRRCLDAGASTGGFTDCLLQRGASHVTAVDVGYGQIHPKLRADPRVLVVERTNIRTLDTDLDDFTGYDVVVADLSFISLTTVAPVLAGPLAASEAEIVVLVKPQFEAGHREVSRGRGVVRDDSVRRAALSRVAGAFDAAGASIMGAMVSPIIGPAGNVEFLLYARAHFPTRPLRDVEEILDSAMTGAR